jgi:hypothetical protein
LSRKANQALPPAFTPVEPPEIAPFARFGFVTLSHHPPRDKIGIMSPPLTPAEMKNFSKIRFQQFNF